MGTIYALLVGIDAYPELTAPPLAGCVNDITGAGGLLRERAGAGLRALTLLDGEATAAAVAAGVRDHLGAAGPGDTALLWFSGHGTDRPATGAELLVEATGRSQALVCADGPLPDKRLGALLDGVAAGGARVAAVLDCCFSGGATRHGELTARFAPPSPHWAPPPQPLPHEPRPRPAGSRDTVVPARPGHVLLAASRLDQPALEGWFDGRVQGVFTHALLAVAREAGPGATYRALLAAADARVGRSGGRQRPVLSPTDAGGAADLPFLDGAVALRPNPYLLRLGAGGWEVDCGTGHGLRDGAGAEGTEFTALADEERASCGPGGAGPRLLRVREVRAASSLVEPEGWSPLPDRVYPVTLSALALPPATVALTAPRQASAPEAFVRAAVREALRDEPLLRVVPGPEQAAGLHFRLAVAGSEVRVLRRDGSPYTAPLPVAGAADAHRVAACLAHLTRWHQLRELTPRPSLLDDLVAVEIAPWGAAEGELLRADGSGVVSVPYRREGGVVRKPWVSIRLHNRSGERPLWCVLLDLTSGYGSHTELYPGHFIAPRHTGHALDGEPVQLSLPADRPEVPGAEAYDWLKLVVAETELNTVPFQLPPWDASSAGSRSRGAAGDGVLRLTAPPGASREAGRVTGRSPGRWTTRTIVVRTVVPD